MDIAQTVLQRHTGLALLLDGLDKIGDFFPEWIGCLAGDGVAITGEGAARARPKQPFSDNGAVIPMKF
jgi:hypothetical protein